MNFGIGNIIFLILLVAGIILFTINVRTIIRNINLGREEKRTDQKKRRWMTMIRVALGQSKMVVRPVAGILHIFVYVGFIIINIEVLEIITDGVLGTHRAFAPLLGKFYDFLIGSFEILALLTILGCAIFLIRRNIIRLKRFWSKEMTSWPRTDANLILFTEIALMIAFLTMNCTDQLLQNSGSEHYFKAGAFPVSQYLNFIFGNMSSGTLEFIERSAWWFHIIGILAFLNYICYSKHFHIILAFPNVWYSNLNAKGKMVNMPSVTKEVKLMLDPSAVVNETANTPPLKFGAKDIQDLTWKQLMDAYSCTECGRCTSVCPANHTGKLLSPRKIMMDTRDRLQEVGKNIDKKGKDFSDGKSLLNDYITPEELWACTSCNACTDACPVNIDPLAIILDMRRFLVMEQSAAPQGLNMMFNNVENNQAPWQFSPSDRLNWAQDEIKSSV